MPTFPNSRAVAQADYDPMSRQLIIQYREGLKRYTYFNVPAYVYEGLLAAPSKGRYVDTQIKPFYSHR
jgi:hypothetical protein